MGERRRDPLISPSMNEVVYRPFYEKQEENSIIYLQDRINQTRKKIDDQMQRQAQAFNSIQVLRSINALPKPY